MMHDMSTNFAGISKALRKTWQHKKVISDNAALFKLASDTICNLWGEILTEDDVISYATNQSVHWDFNVELSPWMGVFF